MMKKIAFNFLIGVPLFTVTVQAGSLLDEYERNFQPQAVLKNNDRICAQNNDGRWTSQAKVKEVKIGTRAYRSGDRVYYVDEEENYPDFTNRIKSEVIRDVYPSFARMQALDTHFDGDKVPRLLNLTKIPISHELDLLGDYRIGDVVQVFHTANQCKTATILSLYDLSNVASAEGPTASTQSQSRWAKIKCNDVELRGFLNFDSIAKKKLGFFAYVSELFQRFNIFNQRPNDLILGEQMTQALAKDTPIYDKEVANEPTEDSPVGRDRIGRIKKWFGSGVNRILGKKSSGSAEVVPISPAGRLENK